MSVVDPSFAATVLHGVGAPVTPRNIAAIEGWAQAEGGAGHNNPLNTTQGAPGASNFNSVGVKVYPSLNEGAQATVTTLRNGRYGGIIAALRAQDPNGVARAIGSSPWGTSGSLVAQTIAQALHSNPQVPVGGTSRSATFTIPGANVQSQIGGGVNIKALGEAILKRAAETPINTSGKVSAGPNLLGDFVSAEKSGLFNAPVQNVTNKLPDMHGSLRTTGDITIAGHGDNVNPIDQADGWQYGRTDQGVDASAHVGAPIRAINTSRVVEVVPNWYHGQPLILFQLTAGPDAGKYWYASEQITSHVHVGQTVPRGAVVASYAPMGTGIEIGWGDPHSAGRTLAQATGGYSEGQVTPAGQDFRRTILS